MAGQLKKITATFATCLNQQLFNFEVASCDFLIKKKRNMSKKKTVTIDLTTAMCKLLNDPEDVQHVYKMSVEDLITSMIDTSDSNVVLVLKNVTKTPLVKATPYAKEFKKQVTKIVKTRQKTFNSNFYKYFYSYLRILYILFYSSGYVCSY